MTKPFVGRLRDRVVEPCELGFCSAEFVQLKGNLYSAFFHGYCESTCLVDNALILPVSNSSQAKQPPLARLRVVHSCPFVVLGWP